MTTLGVTEDTRSVLVDNYLNLTRGIPLVGAARSITSASASCTWSPC